MPTRSANDRDFLPSSPEQLEVAIAAQKREIQRLFKAKDFATMPEAQHALARLLRAKADLRQKQRA
jgi:hypothetical protein